MSIGVAENAIDPVQISTLDAVVSISADFAVIIAPLFTLYLFHSAWNKNKAVKLDIQLKELLIAKEGRRNSDGKSE